MQETEFSWNASSDNSTVKVQPMMMTTSSLHQASTMRQSTWNTKATSITLNNCRTSQSQRPLDSTKMLLFLKIKMQPMKLS